MSIPGICACLIGVPLLVVLFSIDAVEQNEYGLKFNWVTKSLSEDVYHGGTHFVGFWNKFLVFPATVRSIEFSDRVGMSSAPMLHTRTKEGLGLHLSISFQYKLHPEKLHELFAVTNMAYESLYIRIAREQLLEAASEYAGPQYWQERQRIGEHMRQLVDEKMQDNFASLWGLQLQVIDLPDRYEASITQTQVQQQIIKTRENEQVAAGIRANTDVLVAEFDKQIQIVVADAQANYTQETKLASAEASKRRINAEAATVGYVRQKLKLSAADLVRYQQLQSYSMLSNASFMVDMQGMNALVNLPSTAVGASSLLQQPATTDGQATEAAATNLAANDGKGQESTSFLRKRPRSAEAAAGSQDAEATAAVDAD